GVLMKTLLTLRSTDPGFDAQNVLAADLWLPPTRFSRVQDRVAFVTAALDRVRALPGVRGAAFVGDLPLNGNTDTNTFHIVGRPDPSPDRAFRSGSNVVTPGYFELMRIPVREGREFSARDGASAPGVLVVNEAAARMFWPDRSAIGQQISLPIARGMPPELLTVVGVSANVRHEGLAIPPGPEIFVNGLQTTLPWPSLALVVRTASDPAALAASVTSAVRETNPDVPLMRINPLDDVVGRSIAAPRLYSIVFGAFAVLAVALAGIGLYGLVSYSVAQRKQEMGIRMALGATRAELVRLVLTQGVRLAAIGAALGIAGGLAATRVLTGLTAGIRPNDPLTFVVVTSALLLSAIAASYVPARRAARVDPMTALRTE
ncbi:MAG TPA: FtsX-like permease family protein, partial [Vicinamibacterales bacterium]